MVCAGQASDLEVFGRDVRKAEDKVLVSICLQQKQWRLRQTRMTQRAACRPLDHKLSSKYLRQRYLQLQVLSGSGGGREEIIYRN